MNWHEERYVRLYTRNTPGWAIVPWEARAVLPLIMRHLDRSGCTNLGTDGLEGLAALVMLPLEVVATGVAAWVKRGTFRLDGETLSMPNFRDAQEAVADVRIRVQRYRERKAAENKDPVTKCNAPLRDVTDVTPSLALPSLALSPPSPPSGGPGAPGFFGQEREWFRSAVAEASENPGYVAPPVRDCYPLLEVIHAGTPGADGRTAESWLRAKTIAYVKATEENRRFYPLANMKSFTRWVGDGCRSAAELRAQASADSSEVRLKAAASVKADIGYSPPAAGPRIDVLRERAEAMPAEELASSLEETMRKLA